MESEVSVSNGWVYRRFFLSNVRSAPDLFCCNTSDGFNFGQIEFQNDELVCKLLVSDYSGVQIDHLCWFPQTTQRPSTRELQIGFNSIPYRNTSQAVTGIYRCDVNQSKTSLRFFDETHRLNPSSIDFNVKFDRLAVSHINGTVKMYKPSEPETSYHLNFSDDGNLNRLEWNSNDLHLLLMAHSHRMNIFDMEKEKLDTILTYHVREPLADCAWKNRDVLIARHRQQLLIWDKRTSREPVRAETLDKFGQSEKLKCSLAPANDFISVFDARLSKIKIYDWRYLTMRQVESFDETTSSLLDYYWRIDTAALIIATHQGLLHWIDVDRPSERKRFRPCSN